MAPIVTVCYIEITDLRMLWLTNQNQTFSSHVMKREMHIFKPRAGISMVMCHYEARV